MSFDIGASKEFEVHTTIFSHDVWGLENLCNLDKVPARGATVRDYFHRVTFGKMGIHKEFNRPKYTECRKKMNRNYTSWYQTDFLCKIFQTQMASEFKVRLLKLAVWC